MVRIRHSASDRPRARLISTPRTEGTDMTTTIEGIKFSDQLAALVTHAMTHDFRAELDTRGKGGGILLYPPDKEQPVITINERSAKFNKAHYENLRRQLYAAGCPPLPDQQQQPKRATGRRPANTHEEMAIANEHAVHIHNAGDLAKVLADPEVRAHTMGAMVTDLFTKADQYIPVAGLAGGLAYALSVWADDAMDQFIELASQAAKDTLQADLDEALRMAAQHEATAVRLTGQLEKAEERETKAREDCATALRRAEVAEAKAAEAEAALAPLRAFLEKKTD